MGPGEHNSWNIAMRQSLDIYASVVVCKSLPGLKTRHDNVDFAIIRENTEGEYSGLEHQSYPGVVESLKVSTRKGSERIARFAFDFALKNGRKVSTVSHPYGPPEVEMDRVERSARPASGPPTADPSASLSPFLESHVCPQGQHHEARRRTLPPNVH